MSIIGSALQRTWLRRLALFCVLSLSLAGVVDAMRVSPMVVEMTTSGPRASARIEVQNVGAGLLAFETRITRLDYDAAGKPFEVPADEDFLVFPPQGTLPATARQVVRVQWVGPADMPSSQSYYLSVNQLPVAIGQETSGVGGQVQIVYHMKALLTVAPPKAKPVVDVVTAESRQIQPKPAPDAAPDAPLPAKVPGVSVSVRNTGNRYAMLSGVNWIIDGTGADGQPLHLELTREDMSRLIGVGYLAPLKGERTFEFATDKVFAAGSVKVRFTQ